MHVVLVHPEIDWNTGNAGRTCLAVGATLHVIEPLGFSLEDRQVKRAGLDYWEHVELRVWPDWASFERVLPTLGQPYFFSSRSTCMFWYVALGGLQDVVLVFGQETGGLPADLHDRYRDALRRDADGLPTWIVEPVDHRRHCSVRSPSAAAGGFIVVTVGRAYYPSYCEVSPAR